MERKPLPGFLQKPLIVVTGLLAEARIVCGDDVIVMCGGGDSTRLIRDIRARAASGACGILSFGIAGGLAPGFRPGTCVIASAIVDMRQNGTRTWPADAAWNARLHRLLPDAKGGILAGIDKPAATALEKAALGHICAAVAVDMESHLAAKLALAVGLPFAALRVVADTAGTDLPPAALVGMRPDGGSDMAAVLLSLARQPRQLPALIRLALDVRKALARLRQCRLVLGSRFACDI